MTLAPGARFPLPDDHEDRGIYITEGSVSIAGQSFEAGRMMVFRPGDAINVAAGPQGARLMALGGATLNGPRHVWWNFVSSSRDKIEEARRQWRTENWGRGCSICQRVIATSISRRRVDNSHQSFPLQPFAAIFVQLVSSKVA